MDAAFKGADTSDFVAITVWGKRGSDYYLCDCVNRRMGFGETLRAIRTVCARWPQAAPVLIEDNLFFRTQMSAILIADDARSWYESGMVRNVCIRGNRFEECGTPVINIAPENDRDGGCVHSGISIQNNCFRLSGHPAVAAKSVDGLRIEHNTIYSSDEGEPFHTQSCMNVYIQENLNIPKDKGNAHPG